MPKRTHLRPHSRPQHQERALQTRRTLRACSPRHPEQRGAVPTLVREVVHTGAAAGGQLPPEGECPRCPRSPWSPPGRTHGREYTRRPRRMIPFCTSAFRAFAQSPKRTRSLRPLPRHAASQAHTAYAQDTQRARGARRLRSCRRSQCPARDDVVARACLTPPAHASPRLATPPTPPTTALSASV